MDYHIVALSPTRNGFFDPISRVNLTRMSPQGFIPVGSPISGSVKAALLSGGIIDTTGQLIGLVVQEHLRESGITPVIPANPGVITYVNANEFEPDPLVIESAGDIDPPGGNEPPVGDVVPPGDENVLDTPNVEPDGNQTPDTNETSAELESINVKDYGATGDGITNDTAAIQDAIQEALPEQGIELPTGQYVVDNLTVGESTPAEEAALAEEVQDAPAEEALSADDELKAPEALAASKSRSRSKTK